MKRRSSLSTDHSDCVWEVRQPETRVHAPAPDAETDAGADSEPDQNATRSDLADGPSPSRATVYQAIANGRRNGRTQDVTGYGGEQQQQQQHGPTASTTQLPSSSATMAQLSEPCTRADVVGPDREGGSAGLDQTGRKLQRLWHSTVLVLSVALIGLSLLFVIVESLVSHQVDPKGCHMSYMRPRYVKFHEFDTEHTRFASKYSLYLYREQGVDAENKLRGIPVLFIPGNAGSYKQVRPIAAEAANYYHDVWQHQEDGLAGVPALNLDFFTVDFNEDITAFHGQTLLDQAEYLNEAIRYILSLYLDPELSSRDPRLPDPTSVIILGHSMGGIVARTMLVMANYLSNSINTIITMSAPHARPPVTFDGQIVQIYDQVNSYWREAHSQKWASDNPLWHVTLVSIAGGGLDTVVPSDYAGIESLVPETHGFTVFTTTIPSVWTSMDHQAILWCDQFRKVVTRALFGAVDARRPSQTKPRAQRMRVFRARFLTGMEPSSETDLASRPASTLLTVDNISAPAVGMGGRLVLAQLGASSGPAAFFLPIPLEESAGEGKLALLTDAPFGSDMLGEESSGFDRLAVFACGVLPDNLAYPGPHLPSEIDLSTGEAKVHRRLACKSTQADFVRVPMSNRESRYPFEDHRDGRQAAFSYLEYDMKDLEGLQFIAVVDKAVSRSNHFLAAEFTQPERSRVRLDASIWEIIFRGLEWRVSAPQPLLVEVEIPAIRSGLLAYHLDAPRQPCRVSGGPAEMFAPLARQYLSRPYESKYFVNLGHADVNFHGEAPFLPPQWNHQRGGSDEVNPGLALQFWMDPSCGSEFVARLSLDVRGSFGRLYMRYRTILATFPLFIVGLVLREQFRSYDNTGVFSSFTGGLDVCLKTQIPVLLLLLTGVSMRAYISSLLPLDMGNRAPASAVVDFHLNDLLTGTSDPVFWFLTPFIGLVCIGVCVGLHYAVLGLTTVLCGASRLASLVRCGGRRMVPGAVGSGLEAFFSASVRRRFITAGSLLWLISTLVPYQFAYAVACAVQIFSTVKALGVHLRAGTSGSLNFYHYCHSILILMLWILPINLPILAVWVRNLAVHWFTPFSSHHNVWSILPFILLVKNVASGRMVPRIRGNVRHVSSCLLLGTALYSAVYGVSHAYRLHSIVNVTSAWLVVIHASEDSWFGMARQTVWQQQKH